MDHSHGSSGSSSPSSSDNGTAMMMMMKPYLHFTTGDALLFDTIVPMSAGATFGACVVIFFLALLDRWLYSFRHGLDRRFKARARRLAVEYEDNPDGKLPVTESSSLNPDGRPKAIISHAFANGALTCVGTALHYALMLIIMTFNASFIISGVVGAAVGDMMFRPIQ